MPVIALLLAWRDSDLVMYQYWPAPPIKTAGTCRRPSHAELPATVAWQRSKASGKMKWVDTHKSTSILIFKQENNNMQANINSEKVGSRCWVISTSEDLRLSFGLLQLSMREQHEEDFFFQVYLSTLNPNKFPSFPSRSFSASFLSGSSTPSAELGLPPDFSAESCSLWCCTHAYSRLA